METINVAGIVSQALAMAETKLNEKSASPARGSLRSVQTDLSDSNGVVYPLFVDPDWGVAQGSWNYVDSSYPTTSYWDGQFTQDKTAHVGYSQ